MGARNAGSNLVRAKALRQGTTLAPLPSLVRLAETDKTEGVAVEAMQSVPKKSRVEKKMGLTSAKVGMHQTKSEVRAKVGGWSMPLS